MTDTLATYAQEARTYCKMMLDNPLFDKDADALTMPPFTTILTTIDDRDCFAMFVSKMVADISTPDKVVISNELESCPKTCELVRRVALKREPVMLIKETKAYELYLAFKAKLMSIFSTNDNLKEYTKDNPFETMLAIQMFTKMRVMYGAGNTYASTYSTKEGRETMKKMSVALLPCFKNLLEGKSLTPEMFHPSTETFKTYLLKLFEIASKVDPETKHILLQDFKELLVAFFEVFVLWRFPVVMSATAPPVCFGKFMIDFDIKPYNVYLGVKVQPLCIYP